MKRANNLFIKVVDPANLRLAMWKAAKDKRYAPKVYRWFENQDENLSALREELISSSYTSASYRTFLIYEPKERQIAAPAFRDQVVHHACMNVCDPYFESQQIFDSYASRRGKGTFACLDRAAQFHRRHAFFLKLDVRQFFGSIHHEVLKNQLARLFKDAQLLKIFGTIIDSYQNDPQRGLPIGNLTSQYFANHYLAGLDHYCKEQLRLKPYVRYMDDIVVWANDKATLINARDAIIEYVQSTLQQQLKPCLLQRSDRGLPFLGFLLFPHYRKLTQASKRRFYKKAKATHLAYLSGRYDSTTAARRLQSLTAFTRHADATQLRTYFWQELDPNYSHHG
jgi:RNA-directed DNA polymerase